MSDFRVTVQPPATNTVVVNPVTNVVTVTQTTNQVVISSTGVQGVGVPSGGSTNQVLTKLSSADYDTAWTTPSSGGVTSVFSRTGAVTAQSGDYTTSQVTEGSNLYFTNARAINSTLTGYTSGAGTISSSDSILQAIQKLNGNITGLGSTYVAKDGDTMTGALTIAGSATGVQQLLVKMAAGQSAFPVKFTDSTGASTLFQVDTTGNTSIAGGLGSKYLSVVGNSASTVTGIFQGASGQSADLTNWKDFSGTVLARVTSSGAISGSNLSGTNTGDITLGSVGSSPNANGASLSGQALTLQPVSSSFPGILTAAQFNGFTAKLSSTLAANRIFVGSGSNVAVSSGGFTSGSDMTAITYNGSTTKFTVSTLGNGVYAPSFQTISGYSANTLVTRSNDNLGWITVGTGVQGDPSLLPQLYNFSTWYNCSDNLIIDVDNGIVYSTSTGLKFIDINSGWICNPSTGDPVIHAANYQLLDPSLVISGDWNARTLNGVGGGYSLFWDYNNDGSNYIGIQEKINFYNNEAAVANGVASIIGYAEDVSVTSFDLTAYSAPDVRLVRVSLMLEITSPGDGFDVYIEYASETGNTYTQLMMANVIPDVIGVVMNDAGSPRFKNGANSVVITTKSGSSIRVYSTNFTGSSPTMNAKVTVERLN